ncbi:Acyl-coenzyme A oxidase [Aphelenchoides bicaudatus]|nr:Acyl-coenzyme A oxidase [Aphelenchoides bicaudatus]
MPSKYLKAGDNEDLAAERLNCEFNQDDLAARIYGGDRVVQNRKRIQKFVEDNPDLRNTTHQFSFMSRLETIEQSYHNAVAAEKHVNEAIDRDDFDQITMYRLLIDGDEGHPFLLTHFLVLPMLENNVDDEQRRMFIDPVKKHVWPTAYLQTELKHGTNVNNLETTATYDPRTQEFVLHSPTRTSYKWWSGNLAVSAQMGVVMAQLWTQGKCYGMHPFFVQLRDFETHEPMLGIQIGDIGENFGLVAHDIGFVRFDHCRVPRKSLLMKHFKVHPDGRYQPPLHPRLAYTGMMFARSRMIHDIGHDLAACVTIALRFSCIRRQGLIGHSKQEVKIIDYQTQQYRILPQLARALSFCLTGLKARRLYFKVMEEVKHGNVILMEDLHAITSGLKAVVSHQGSLGAEQCRLSCGGHGYTLAARIPQLCARIIAGSTYEARRQPGYVVADENQQKVTEIAAYLYKKSPTHSAFQLKNQDRSQQWINLQTVFEHISRRLTLKAFNRLQAFKKQGDSHEIAWNKCTVDLTKASKAHTRTFLTRTFMDTVFEEQKPELREVLSDLFNLYMHYELQDCRADAMEDGFMSGKQIRQSDNELKHSLAQVRKNAINLSDSFDLPDRYLCSVLGRRDGNVYEGLWEWTKENPLNNRQVLPFHRETIGKLMEEAKMHSKL